MNYSIVNKAYSKRLRFPRTKLIRRLEKMDDELKQWELAYEARLKDELTPVLEAKVRQRMQQIDFVRHGVFDVCTRLIEIT